MMKSTQGTIYSLLLALALSAAQATSPSLAADITVGGECSLADAIAAANSDAPVGGCPTGDGSDTITLTHDVTLEAELPYIRSAITINGAGHLISGDLSHRIFRVGETDFAVTDVTLKEGRARGGSAIYSISSGRISVSNAVFEGNYAVAYVLDFGGAIQCWPCSLTIDGSLFRANTSSGPGGAIYFAGIDAGHVLRISNSRFEKNHAEDGAGIYIANYSPDLALSISGSTFYDNWTPGAGGAIFHRGSEDDSELFIVNSTFHANLAYQGGALAALGGARTTLAHVTFAHNSAGEGSSVFGVGVNLYNSILFGQRNEHCFRGVESTIGSLSDDNSCASPRHAELMLDELVAPADGSPPYFPLPSGSAAIDAVACDLLISFDQIGTPRPQGEACDTGAIEFMPDAQ